MLLAINASLIWEVITVWKYICGGYVLEIFCSNSTRAHQSKFILSHSIRGAYISEEKDELESLDEASRWNAHRSDIYTDPCPIKSRSHRLRLNWLRKCRQIYNEARHIPYSHNMFSFYLPLALKQFINFLNSYGNDYKMLVRRLRIHMHECFGSESFAPPAQHEWQEATRAVVSNLKNVSYVGMMLYQKLDFGMPLYPNLEPFDTGMLARDRSFQTILSLRRLHLQGFTFVIANPSIDYASPPQQRHDWGWGLEVKNIWTRHVKDIFLRRAEMPAKQSKNTKHR